MNLFRILFILYFLKLSYGSTSVITGRTLNAASLKSNIHLISDFNYSPVIFVSGRDYTAIGNFFWWNDHKALQLFWVNSLLHLVPRNLHYDSVQFSAQISDN